MLQSKTLGITKVESSPLTLLGCRHGKKMDEIVAIPNTWFILLLALHSLQSMLLESLLTCLWL
jgi:hypothetical protein